MSSFIVSEIMQVFYTNKSIFIKSLEHFQIIKSSNALSCTNK